MLDSHKNIKLINFLSLIWLSHFIQVLVPETGFDAVWYHLPVIDQIIKNGKIVFNPEIYQSLNPLFSDLIFMFGYYFFSETGAKLIAYVFALFLVFTSYKLSRFFLSKRLSLGVVILISTFQVVSWQAASFYVDVAKAFWEILAIYFIIKSVESNNLSDKFRSGLSFSASLATKLFSIFLLPVYLFIVTKTFSKTFRSETILILLLSLIFPAYFYLNSYIQTGNFFYSFSIHLNKLSEIGGESNILFYILNRIILFPISPFQLIVSRDYVSPIITFFMFPIFLKRKEIIQNNKLNVLLIFSISQWTLWWFLPPLSTRYAISGFITILILGIGVLAKYFPKISTKQIIITLIFFASINLIPRILVNYRSLKFLFSDQTQKQYVEQFYDGSIDQKLREWYKI